MIFSNILKNKSFLVYGLGLTGISAIKFLKKIGVKNIFIWDDNSETRKKYNLKYKEKNIKKRFSDVDYIVLSPGISLIKSKKKRYLKRNKNKIITDIDLFFLTNKIFKSIVVTGTNGKSTTCSIIHKVLSNSGINSELLGNIGKPILNYNLGKKKNVVLVIEMSSFQLEYSKYIRPNHAIFINFTKDHLDWHGNINNYLKSKLKIFSLQNKNDFAYLPQDKDIIKRFKKNNFRSSVILNKRKNYNILKKNIINPYLSCKSNLENLSFIYDLKNNFKISDKGFFSILNKFKGLPHRQEIFLKKNNVFFINDSKATTFEATKACLMNYKNILWILGGLKKKDDDFNINKFKKNVLSAFIIGKERSFFKSKINNKIKYFETINLKQTMKYVFDELRYMTDKKSTIYVILSPASASYDQFKNFEERGNQFKKLIIYNAKKYF